MIDITESWLLQKIIQEMTDTNIISLTVLTDSISKTGDLRQDGGRYSAVNHILKKMEAGGYAVRLDGDYWTLTR